jgi:hypothetical protein
MLKVYPIIFKTSSFPKSFLKNKSPKNSPCPSDSSSIRKFPTNPNAEPFQNSDPNPLHTLIPYIKILNLTKCPSKSSKTKSDSTKTPKSNSEEEPPKEKFESTKILSIIQTQILNLKVNKLNKTYFGNLQHKISAKLPQDRFMKNELKPLTQSLAFSNDSTTKIIKITTTKTHSKKINTNQSSKTTEQVIDTIFRKTTNTNSIKAPLKISKSCFVKQSTKTS